MAKKLKVKGSPRWRVRRISVGHAMDISVLEYHSDTGDWRGERFIPDGKREWDTVATGPQWVLVPLCAALNKRKVNLTF